MGSLVSVIIPTYNRGYSIVRCVESVLQQTHQPVEVLIVDDGSKDDTSEVIATRYKGDTRVRYIRQENQGVSAARNTGLRNAQGDFIAFLDSDDSWKPWKLEIQLACLQAFPEAGMVWSDMDAVGPDGKVSRERYLKVMYGSYRRFTKEQLFTRSVPLAKLAPRLASTVGENRAYFGDIYSQILTGNLVHTSTVVLRRERQKKVGEFNLELRPSGEDHEFHLRTCREGPVAFVDIPTIFYQIGLEDQLTHPKYMVHIARNYLKAVLPWMERDKDRIHLPPGMLDDVLARANARLGELLVESGNRKEGRNYLYESLRHKGWQPRVAVWLALGYMPAGILKSTITGYRWMKRKLVGPPGGAKGAPQALRG